MTLLQLQYIQAVASCGSMSRAAEKLHISQPALSSTIRDLEKEIGLTIFQRSNRGVCITSAGADFLHYAQLVCMQFDQLQAKYSPSVVKRQAFAISMQHYSFAVEAFIRTARQYENSDYELALRETKSMEVLRDVAEHHSDIGLLYRSRKNRKLVVRFLTEYGLEFHSLGEYSACVYMWKGHPLAQQPSLTMGQLKDYPCLSFAQSNEYFAEEIRNEKFYPKTVKITDRATMLNLMRGMNGYTLCCGVISEEMNSPDYVAIPFCEDTPDSGMKMEIGYIQPIGAHLNEFGEAFIAELRRCLQHYQ